MKASSQSEQVPSVLAVIALFIFAITLASTIRAQNSTPLSPEQQQLVRAQTENYQAQTAKINEERSLWQRMVNIGAFAVAIVAVLSFVLNYSSTLRTQRDAQFLEALKRFGDPDSATVRSSGAGLLAKLSNQRSIFLRWQTPNLNLVIDQLMAGLVLEKNSVCLNSIRNALAHVATHSPLLTVDRMRSANFELQKEMVEVLAQFLATVGYSAEHTPDIRQGHWRQAAALTPYEADVLSALTVHHDEKFRRTLEPAVREFDSLDPPKKPEQIAAAQKTLRANADRLSLNVEIYTLILKTDPFRQVHLKLINYPSPLGRMTEALNMENVFLAKADLSNAKLRGVNLKKAQLQNASLFGVDLRDSNLFEVDFRGSGLSSADLRGANMIGARLDPLEVTVKTSTFQSSTRLENCDLRGANLGYAKLRDTSARGSKFAGASLTYACLYGLEIDEKTDLSNARWWEACFMVFEPGVNDRKDDTALVEKLYDRYGSEVPDPLDHTQGPLFDLINARKQVQSALPNDQM